MQSPTNQNRDKRNMKYDLSKIELSEKNFKFGNGLNRVIFTSMNKLELCDVLPTLKGGASFYKRLTSQTEYVLGCIDISIMRGVTSTTSPFSYS